MSCELLPIYWGSSANSSLTAAQVQALQNSVEQTNKRGSYAFGELASSQYLWFASPQSFGAVGSFSVGPMNLVCAETEITLTVDGVSVDYYLYQSPELLIGEIDPWVIN